MNAEIWTLFCTRLRTCYIIRVMFLGGDKFYCYMYMYSYWGGKYLCMYAVADVLRMYVFVHKLFVFLGTTEIFVCIWYGIFCWYLIIKKISHYFVCRRWNFVFYVFAEFCSSYSRHGRPIIKTVLHRAVSARTTQEKRKIQKRLGKHLIG